MTTAQVQAIRAEVRVGKGSGGHWPRGRRRHSEAGWSAQRKRLQRLISRGGVTRVQMAREIGVSETSVRRWLRGEDIPAPQYQEAIAAWLAECINGNT